MQINQGKLACRAAAHQTNEQHGNNTGNKPSTI